MVPLQMLDHLELLLGSVGAVATAERLPLGVREVVVSQTRRPPEGLVAQAARIWPIVTVLTLVGLQYKSSLEGFAAFLADIWAHVAVLRVPVGTESIRSVSAVLTLITDIRFVPCVLSHVVLQLSRPLAFVAALRTKVLLLLSVNPHVKLQPRRVGAGVSALLTAVRLLPGVYADVPRDLLLVLG